MKIVLIGGMDRLKPDYEKAARQSGHKLKSISRNERNFESRIGQPDAIIIFTNKISHAARDKAARYGQALGVPMRFAHSCGVSTLRECLPKTPKNA